MLAGRNFQAKKRRERKSAASSLHFLSFRGRGGSGGVDLRDAEDYILKWATERTNNGRIQ